MKLFALTGVSGFVAPRHLHAIKSTGNELVAAMDISDSAGVLDSYFPSADFFTDPGEFKHFIEQCNKKRSPVDYVSVCTPNHLHEENIRMAVLSGADVICEKPLVLDPDDAQKLKHLENSSGKKIFNILQLRHHPGILDLKKKTEHESAFHKYEIDLAYVTPRGKWYHNSWKGDPARSGGIATNIGIHFFDMLIWIFGSVQNCIVQMHNAERSAGFLELEKARVRWFLSINETDLPDLNNRSAVRSMVVNGHHVDFSSGFTELHKNNYSSIMAGQGCRIDDVMPSIELAHTIRFQEPVGKKGEWHPMANLFIE